MHGLSIKTLVSWHVDNEFKYNNTLAVLMNPTIDGSTATAAGSIIAFDQLENVSFRTTTHDEFSHLCKLVERAVFLERLVVIGDYPLLCICAYSDKLWNT